MLARYAEVKLILCKDKANHRFGKINAMFFKNLSEVSISELHISFITPTNIRYSKRNIMNGQAPYILLRQNLQTALKEDFRKGSKNHNKKAPFFLIYAQHRSLVKTDCKQNNAYRFQIINLPFTHRKPATFDA